MVYEFGPFSLDVEERQIRRGSEQIRLEPKAFDVLRFLVEHAGQLVTKQELINSIWSGLIVGDNSLTRCIHQIRWKIEDSSEKPAFLETVRGSGYRFIAPVRILSKPAPIATQSWQRKAWSAFAILLPVSFASVWLLYGLFGTGDSVIRRIAVLPLENFSGELDQDYFVDGIHEALIGELSHIEGFDVISRSSVLAYSRGTVTLQEIASALDVDTVVEGSVARSGESLTVSIQLVQIQPERNLWAGRFHRDVADVFEVTTGIARAIAEEVSVELSEIEQTLLTSTRAVDGHAFDRYLQARSLHSENPPRSAELALDLYREAMEIDSEFAPAYVGLADAIGAATVFGLRDPIVNIPVVRGLTETALGLDSTLAAAHRLDAAVSFYGSWNVRAAEEAALRALGLDPNFAGAYKLIAEVYAVSGRPDEAWKAIERGRSLDPIPPISRFKPALILYLSREFSGARNLAIEELEANSGFWQGHWLHCLSSSALGFHDEAIDACRSAVTLSNRTPMALGALGYSLARGGLASEAQRIAEELNALRETRYVCATFLAMIFGALGETDRAIDEARRAYDERDINLVYIKVAEYYDSLRNDERFEQIAAQVSSVTSL